MADFEISKVQDPLPEQEAARDYWSGLDNFAGYARPKPWSTFMASRILSFSPSSVFEFGCNAGKNLAAIRERNSSVFACGVDVNAAAVRHGEQSGLRLAAGDERLLKIFPDLTFDVTFTVSVIDHVATPGEILTELARITRRKLLLLEPWLGEEGKVERNVNITTGELIDTTPYSYSWDYHRLTRQHLPGWQIEDEPYALQSNLGRFYRLYTLTR
ncbi:class I SAM-dependent methyltransferase [Sinorhizobium garamanticum]|uniref:Class I SAM-dependent methyltransferase n=1 Tax=Sinorhizobium garamanticum TaxID=680247 RepID=A0ABY8DQ42_9HYPH|nr:methionine biosynthesis protein MetW [Sinorhizobium garamanticum]WEX91076.1 class I SAM-dependent methyltransferase [Sinorhizobium garamanticum]